MLEAPPPTPGGVHWLRNRRIVVWLTLAWALLTLSPLAMDGWSQVQIFGLPLAVWLAAQGVPIAYVAIVWYYERRMDRLDRGVGNPDAD